MRVLDISEIKIASINGKYEVGRNGRLFLSPKYRAFKDELVLRCRMARIQPPYAVTISIATPCDIDNSIKAILDALQAKGVITDDKHVRRLAVDKREVRRGQSGALIVDVDHLTEAA